MDDHFSATAENPLGRTWGRLGDLVFRAARGPFWLAFLPLRFYFVLCDRVLFRWWWFAYGGLEGIDRFGPYRKADAAFGRFWWWWTSKTTEWLAREIGE